MRHVVAWFFDLLLLYPLRLIHPRRPSLSTGWLHDAWMTTLAAMLTGSVVVALVVLGALGKPYGTTPFFWAFGLYVLMGAWMVVRSTLYVVTELVHDELEAI